jgi:L-threonylcarbamoyladenylate synthase
MASTALADGGLVAATPQNIARAAALLAAGGLVAFPTETVYGLGASARDPAAVTRVFAAKGRPADHPLIVHLAAAEDLEQWARTVPEAARRLARAFWPGPLTLVLPRRPEVADVITGGQDSVALRVPAHPVALALLQAAGPLVAPSANRFGRVSPTTAAHVRDELGTAVDLILDGGPCSVGVESSIVGLLGEAPVLLRPGGISPARLEAVLGQPLMLPHRAGGADTPRVPGALASHYAPATPLEVCSAGALAARADELVQRGLRVRVLALGEAATLPASAHVESMPVDAAGYARVLYATLRRLDDAGHGVILVEAPPESPDWLAVRDRLARAAHRRG